MRGHPVDSDSTCDNVDRSRDGLDLVGNPGCLDRDSLRELTEAVDVCSAQSELVSLTSIDL